MVSERQITQFSLSFHVNLLTHRIFTVRGKLFGSNHTFLISLSTPSTTKIRCHSTNSAKKRKIYDDAKSGRFEATARSSARSQSTRDYSSRDYSSRYAGSRYSDYTSSKSPNYSSLFRGLFEKTYSRFFGGRLISEKLFLRVVCVL
jgi:hypothetical protein